VHAGVEDHARPGWTWTGLSVVESIRMSEDRDKWRRYVHGVAKPRIEAKEQNRDVGEGSKSSCQLSLYVYGGPVNAV